MDATKYRGGIFSERVNGGRSAVLISLSRLGVGVFIEKNDAQLLLKWHQIVFSVGGSNGRMIFMRHPDSGDVVHCNEKSFVDSLFAFPDGTVQNFINDVKIEFTRKQRNKKIGCYALLTTAVFLCWAVYFLFTKIPDLIVNNVPPSVDVSIGQMAANDLSSFGPPLEDSEVNEAVNTILKRLVDNMPAELRPTDFSFRMQVINSNQINAFALPGGQMVVLRGLIDILDKPEELAAVMAHELSHVTQRHGLKNVVRQVGLMNSVYLLVGGGDLLSLATQVGGSLALQNYSRGAEREADSVGVDILHTARIDPLHLESAFARMEEAQKGELDLSVLSIFSSHPDLNERMESVRIKASKLPSVIYEPIDIDWSSVKQKVGYSNDLKEGD